METLVADNPPARAITGWDAAVTPDVWQIIRERYVKGDRLTVLSEEFGLQYNTVQAKSARDGWRRLREDRERADRAALTTPASELANQATIQKMLGPQTDYIAQVDAYRANAASLQDQYNRTLAELDEDLETGDRVALRRVLIALHERIQEALSIPSVKPVEIRQSGSERRVAAVPVG